jgi:ABC-type phosphate transport system ATPase subunit
MLPLRHGPQVFRNKGDLEGLVEKCLRQAALWDEVKDRLDSLGTKLSGGQQQRLTIARALSHQPEILCLDEFSIAIDPVTTMRIEDVLKELQKEMTIILVTNLVQQARRLARRTMFLWNGEISELDRTDVIFSETPRPTEKPTNTSTGYLDERSRLQHHDTRRLPLVCKVPGVEKRFCERQTWLLHLIGPSGCGKTIASLL